MNTEAVAHPACWPRRIGILNDFVRIVYPNGSSFASQFLYRELSARGHDVTIIGPSDPEAKAEDLPRNAVCLPAVPMRNHPGVRLPLPAPGALAQVAAKRFDLMLGQTTSELADLGVWLRWTQHVPFVCVNTWHLPSMYNILLPDRLLHNPRLNRIFNEHINPFLEKHSTRIYNQTDGLIVLCDGLEGYWRKRGVQVPIHVVSRSVDPLIFDRPVDRDPFAQAATRGSRLLVACRHAREKSVDRLIRIFARVIAKRVPEASLTLIGDGLEHETFRRIATREGVGGRTFFPGEIPLTDMPMWYKNADLFVYTSLSETYGQVVSEAMWCGLPVVAFADGMGVSHQVSSGRNGLLIQPGPDIEAADHAFGEAAIALLQDAGRRAAFSEKAVQDTRRRVHPARILTRYEAVFREARRHCTATVDARIATPWTPVRALTRWAWVQLGATGLGCIRPPAPIHHHNRVQQPSWECPPAAPLPAAGWLAARAPDAQDARVVGIEPAAREGTSDRSWRYAVGA